MIKFGTGGFRGVIGDDFNRENICIIAEALSRIIKEDGDALPVVIGYDNRFMSDFFAGWMAEVFAAHGIKSYLYTHQMPSPAVMCATRDLDLNYGIMITASHNPYKFNGVKLFLRGGVDADVSFTNRMERKIIEIENGHTMVEMKSLEDARKEGLVTDFSNLNQYVEHIKGFVSPKIKDNNIKILYDNLCGVGFVGLERLSQEFQIKQFDILHKNHDAFFSFELPNPTKEMLLSLKSEVLSKGYDYAMATDSDGDRLGILDEHGEYVDNNDILASLYYYLVKYRGMKGDVVKNCATSVLLDKVAKRLGYRCHEVDVGFKNISAKMLETNALIGGESSGGLTCRGYLYGKDSAFSSSLFMEMRILMKKTVSEIMKEVHNFAEYTYVSLESEATLKDMEKSRAFLWGNTPDMGRIIIEKRAFGNNVKYLLENDCWALLRFSGTEPLLRIFVEAETLQEAKRLMQVLKKYVKTSEGNECDERKNCAVV